MDLPKYDSPPYGKWVTNASCPETLQTYQVQPGYKIGPPLIRQSMVASFEAAGICGIYEDPEVCEEPLIVAIK